MLLAHHCHLWCPAHSLSDHQPIYLWVPHRVYSLILTFFIFGLNNGLNLSSKFDYGCIGGSRCADCVNGFSTTKPGGDCQQISDQQQTKQQSQIYAPNSFTLQSLSDLCFIVWLRSFLGRQVKWYYSKHSTFLTSQWLTHAEHEKTPAQWCPVLVSFRARHLSNIHLHMQSTFPTSLMHAIHENTPTGMFSCLAPSVHHWCMPIHTNTGVFSCSAPLYIISKYLI